VAELADARDLKSLDPDTGRAGSTPAPGISTALIPDSRLGTAFDFRNLQSTICNRKWLGPLAQMEEHLIFNPVAAGSNPASCNAHSILDSRFKIADWLLHF
jgi:hypothetical protein